MGLRSLIVVVLLAAAPRLAISDPELCEPACHQVAQCGIMTFDTCYTQCKQTGAERDARNAEGLKLVAKASCRDLAAAMPKTPAPAATPSPAAAPAQPATSSAKAPGGKKLWQCWASGSWRKCETKGFGNCFSQFTSQFSFGSSEQLARMAAETQCSSAMSGMMSTSFTTRNSIAASCHATSCTPP